ncbi:MAG: DUF2855 family protein [Pseudomonadota bacterium]
MPTQGTHLVVNPQDLSDCKFVEQTFPDPAPGRSLLRVDSYAMTANNITYGRASGQLGYWEFFPVEDPTYGRIPVWGFADVVASNAPEVAEGTRLYGFLPMSTHLEIEPGKVTGRGLMDDAEARKGKAPIYNQYSICSGDPMYAEDQEGMISLFRPLYTTSFLLDDFFRRNALFGAEAVALTSASSKTALGMAHAMKAGGTESVTLIGLTSHSNIDFVRGLGVYDAVVAYDDLDGIQAASLAYVDMAGNGTVRRSLHERYADELKHACLVGGTHWTGRDRDVKGLPGPKPEFFFAPTYAQERIAEWGGAEFQTRLGTAWGTFLTDASRWIDVVETPGAEAAKRIYLETLAGRVSPDVGNILSMR